MSIDICPRCTGTGKNPFGPGACPVCNGSGRASLFPGFSDPDSRRQNELMGALGALDAKLTRILELLESKESDSVNDQPD